MIIFPIWLIALDYLLAIFMLILIIKFILNIFIHEENKLGLFRFITKITNIISNFLTKLIPDFIVKPIIPLYLAWLTFMIRIYILPLLINQNAFGKFAFIFEKDLITLVNSSMLEIALYLNFGI